MTTAIARKENALIQRALNDYTTTTKNAANFTWVDEDSLTNIQRSVLCAALEQYGDKLVEADHGAINDAWMLSNLANQFKKTKRP